MFNKQFIFYRAARRVHSSSGGPSRQGEGDRRVLVRNRQGQLEGQMVQG